jgi:hypothetical protein
MRPLRRRREAQDTGAKEPAMSSEHPARDPAREPLVRVAVAADDFEAQLMHDQLAAAGIRSMVREQDALASAGIVGVASPFSREIFVLEGDAERAAAVLAEKPAPPPQGGGAPS